MNKIVLASNNLNKIKELNQNFPNIAWQSLSCFGIAEIDETGFSFVENALLKARNASKISNLPALADDSGLCVKALNGAPGIYSARFAGNVKSDSANNQKLLELMQSQQNRSAMFVCVLVYVNSFDDPLPIIAQGVWYGEIALKPKGENGFGYDPIFYLPDMKKTAAMLTLAEKNRFSHRAKALVAFWQKYCEQY